MIAHTPGIRTAGLARPVYRADIDGLRAIAVLAVVGFHAFPSWFRGGFTGVDVFFVISGFLISTMIFSSLEQDRFSFVEFYSRRIRRIFPALLVILLVGGVLGWFTLPPDEYKQLGKHTAGGAGFVSNFVLWNESGYFDNPEDTKPLLHLWSLGIEEQFYIVWPLLLWLVWKLRWNLLAITIVVGVVSFLLNVITAGIDPTEAFYSPLCRIWELMAGSALAYASRHTRGNGPDPQGSGHIASPRTADPSAATLRNVQSVAGAVLVAAGIVILTDDRTIPGWWAVLPALGTLLIVSAGTQAWLNRAILSNHVLVGFGLISYPLYLWHWLLLSFARVIEYSELTVAVRLALVLVSIALAWLTYRLVEGPIRAGGHGTAKTIPLVVLMALVGYAGYTTYARDGFSFRFKDREPFLEYFDNSPPAHRYVRKILGVSDIYRYECNFWDAEKYFAGQQASAPLSSIARDCYERERKFGNAVFIWGDSHAQVLYVGLRDNLPPNWQLLQVATSGCVPSVDSTQPSRTNYCAHSNWFAVKAIGEARPDVVILAQNSRQDFKSFSGISDKLLRLGVRKVILVGASPHWVTDLPKIIANKLWLDTPRRTYVGIDQRFIENNHELARTFKRSDTVAFVDLIGFFCNDAGCLTYLGDDRKTGLTSYDRAHLTPIASDYLARHLLVEQIIGGAQSR